MTIPADLLAAHVADTFMRVLDWWVHLDARIPAPEADRLFRALVSPVGESALSERRTRTGALPSPIR